MGSILRPPGPFSISRIAIIGAGPSGLATAKYLLAENTFCRIDIYEQQSEVGGVWNYTHNVSERVSVPQTSPQLSPELPTWPGAGKAPIFSNPMYEKLNTNIPKGLMCFSDLAFPETSLLFPTREDVQDYLVRYSKDIRHRIAFSTQVEDVQFSQQNGQDQWRVTSKSTITSEKKENDYDALVIASGHFSVPFIPSVPGIELFNKAYPNIVSHSKTYRSPAVFKDKKVIIVGSAASGLDIGTQICEICQKPLLNSVRTSPPAKLRRKNKEEVSPIAEYIVKERAVRFEDGRIEKDIDVIIYCTGYMYSYPFLKSLHPPVITTGNRARGLYQQIFSIIHLTLAWTALPQKIVPFPVSEAQAGAIAKVWSNKISLPSTSEMEDWEKQRVDELGDESGFHMLDYPKDAEYINSLYDWVMSAKEKLGKKPAYWGEKQLWMRENCGAMRKKWVDDGGNARRVEELGFEFVKGEL